MKTLVIGYGNPGRLDDGLGPAAAKLLELERIPGVTIDSDYQLLVEDAEAASRHDVVVFVDASVSGAEPFEFKKLEPSRQLSFSTHSVEPGAVVGLAHELFNSDVSGYMLAIRGYEFNEFEERLSDKAASNLEAAVEFIIDVLRAGRFDEATEEDSAASPDVTQ